ncbi:MAG: DUF3570 domain-containing protein [Methylococcaceae bacterium]
MAVTKFKPKSKQRRSNASANLLIDTCRYIVKHLTGPDRQSQPVSPSLHALTAAALALPGLMLSPVCAAQENEAGFEYSHYNEGERTIGVKHSFNPIEVDSLLGTAIIKLSDRIKFAFNYTQDTWGGATPIATAPKTFEGNRLQDGTINSGATPYLFNQPLGGMYFDKNLNPLKKDNDGNVLRPFTKDSLVHTLSMASPETRKQGDFKLGYEWDEMALDIGGGISSEHDYESRFGNLQGRWDFNQKLTSLNLGLSYTNSDTSAILDHDARPYINVQTYADQIERTYNGTLAIDTLYGNRQDWATHLGLTQLINKNALVEAGVGYTRSTGYMANPYKTVMFAFIPVQTTNVLTGELRGYLEKRPEERNQWTTNLRYVQYVDFLDAALHFDYRFFSDDWDINAHTFEGDWVQPLGWGWTITPRIRYYTQDAASFYQPYFTVRQQAPSSNAKPIVSRYDNYSSDHRLSGYGALNPGVTLSKVFAKGINIEAGFDYYGHAGYLKLGDGGEGDYANFDYWAVTAGLKVDLSALSLAGGGHDEHSGHNHHGGHVDHAPAGVMFAHMMPKSGDMMIGYRYMYSNQSGDVLNGTNAVNDRDIVNNGCTVNPCYVAPNEMNMHMHMIDLMYAPTDWLNLMLMPQFVDMNMTFRYPDGAPQPSSPPISAAVDHAGHEHDTGGVGDLGMYALFKLLDVPGHHLHTAMGLSAPTGDVDIKLRRTHKQDLGFIHYGMQLGSGTWDFKPSITYTGQSDKWSWGAQLNGTVRMDDPNESGYALSNIFQSTAWGSYSLLDWLSASVRGVYTEQGKNSGQYNGTFRKIGPMDYPANYGGSYLDIGFGVNAFVPKGDLAGNSLSFEWLQPLVDDVNGYQLEREGALSATWSLAF